MDDSPVPLNPSIEDVISILLDEDVPLFPRYLYCLSDLEGEELEKFKLIWPTIPDWRRQDLLENLEQLFADDTLLSFENICRIALEDPSPQLRFIALRSLQEYEVKDLVPKFLKLAENDEDDEIRAIAISTLSKYVYLGEIEKISKDKQKEIENCLFNAFREETSALIKRKAVEALGYSSNKDVIEIIDQAFKSNDESWMISAIIAMGRSYDSRWNPYIVLMLDHQNPDIRFEAIRAAGELEIVEAKPVLLELLEDSDRDIRMAAIGSLSLIGGSGLQTIFENLLTETDNDEELEIIENALDIVIFNQSLGLVDFSDYE